MRLLALLIAMLAATAASSQAHTLPDKCRGVTVEQLKAYLEQASGYLKHLEETAWEIPDPKDATKQKTVKLSELLKDKITALEGANLQLIKQCAEVLHASLSQPEMPPRAAPPSPPPAGIRIVTASYGDHKLQHRCEHADVYRGRGHHSRCSFVCDAIEAVKMTCSSPIKGTELTFVEAGTQTPVKVDANNKLQVGSKQVELLAGRGPGAAVCRVTVGDELCFNLDPSPDSPTKSLVLSYACGDKATPTEIVAGRGATILLSCPEAVGQ